MSQVIVRFNIYKHGLMNTGSYWVGILINDPLFPRVDEKIEKSFWRVNSENSSMKNVNELTHRCVIIPLNVVGEDMGKLTTHYFRIGGPQHIFGQIR